MKSNPYDMEYAWFTINNITFQSPLDGQGRWCRWWPCGSRHLLERGPDISVSWWMMQGWSWWRDWRYTQKVESLTDITYTRRRSLQAVTASHRRLIAWLIEGWWREPRGLLVWLTWHGNAWLDIAVERLPEFECNGIQSRKAVRPGRAVDDVILDWSYTTYVLKLQADTLIYLLYVQVTG